MDYKVFSIGPDWKEFIAANTEEEAMKYHLSRAEYDKEELEDIACEEIDLNSIYWFENEKGGMNEMTWKEWLSDFKYKEPKLLCWTE